MTNAKALNIQPGSFGCDIEDGRAPPYMETEEFGTLVRTDRLACDQLRKYSDPTQAWDSILTVIYGATDKTFADFFAE